MGSHLIKSSPNSPGTASRQVFLEDHCTVPHRWVKLSADTGALVAVVSFDDTNKGKNRSVNLEFKSLYCTCMIEKTWKMHENAPTQETSEVD